MTPDDEDATFAEEGEVTREPSPAEQAAAAKMAAVLTERVLRPASTGGHQTVPIESSRYQIGAEIGRGGMGLVVNARDQQIGRDVAIKLIRGKVPSDRTIHRFVREAQIQGRLEHPSIVPVHEIGTGTDGRPFFAMKKLVGTTLAQILEHPKPSFPRQRLLRAFVDVCLALEFAHTRGFVHRDIKPANIMLGDFGEVYVLDWGVAKSLVDGAIEEVETGESDTFETRAGTAVGTLRYMSPEQLKADGVVDGRSDIYSLGAMLFEILAGKRLYENGTERLMTGSTRDTSPAKRAPDRDVPPELDLLCMHALEIDPSVRVQSARDLSDKIQEYLDGDRDVALRRTLAQQHLSSAGEAYLHGETDDARRRAMRDAGTALALDPTLRGAAELVSRMMLDPPRSTPKEVDAEIAAADQIALRGVARVATWSYLAYTAFAIMLFILAPAYWQYGVTLIALAAFGLVMAGRGIAGNRLPAPWFVVVCNATAVLVLCRLASPLLIAPGIVAVTATTMSLSPRFESTRAVVAMTASLTLAILVPWIAETVGIISPTVDFAAGSLTMRAPVLGNVAFAWSLMLIYMLALIGTAVGAVYSTRRRERSMRKHLQTQAWQLRQLVV